MTVSKSTTWVAGTIAVALLVITATWLLLITPQREQATDLANQLVAAEQNNAAIETRTAQLKAQFATLDAHRAKLAEVRATMPENADVPQLLRQLEGYAASAGVVLTGVTPSAAVPFSAPPAEGQQPQAAAAGSVVAVPLTVTVTGTFAETQLFLKNLQADMRRFYLIENLAVDGSASPGGAEVSSTLTGKIFVLRDEAAAPVAPATTTPAPADPSSEVVN